MKINSLRNSTEDLREYDYADAHKVSSRKHSSKIYVKNTKYKKIANLLIKSKPYITNSTIESIKK